MVLVVRLRQSVTMQLARFLSSSGAAVGRLVEAGLQPLDLSALAGGRLQDILSADQPLQLAERLPPVGSVIPLEQVAWLPPIDRQEVWAAGVTYLRSRAARMEESEAAADCYERVYRSERPELFFKATPARCSGHGGPLRIRWDSHWNVPEPELTLVVNPRLQIVGYTVGNDMSSRDIEGDNPLYLPQAKLYRQCCGLGPWITLAEAMPARDKIDIDLRIHRGGAVVFEGASAIRQMARGLEDLVAWLGREQDFPDGVFLLTGTGIVPEAGFSLAAGDQVDITISGIGTLTNRIVAGERDG